MSIKERVRTVTSIDRVSCWTDRFITVGREIRFISLFGTSIRVKTITAIIIKGEAVYLHECWRSPGGLGVTRPDRKIKAITRQLARGVMHCLLYVPDYLVPEGEFAEKTFYGDSKEQILEKFFYAAQKRYSTPLLPAWSEWLMDQMLQVDEIESLGFKQVEGVQFLEEENLETILFEDAGSPLSVGAIAVNG